MLITIEDGSTGRVRGGGDAAPGLGRTAGWGREASARWCCPTASSTKAHHPDNSQTPASPQGYRADRDGCVGDECRWRADAAGRRHSPCPAAGRLYPLVLVRRRRTLPPAPSTRGGGAHSMQSAEPGDETKVPLPLWEGLGDRSPRISPCPDYATIPQGKEECSSFPRSRSQDGECWVRGTDATTVASVKEPKTRADQLLVDRGLVESKTRAQALILAGKIYTGDRPRRESRPAPTRQRAAGRQGTGSSLGVAWRPQAGPCARRVSDCLPSTGLVCVDVGASTGGFTDVLLTQGAARVHAVDVGHGQLAWKLRSDPRVVRPRAHQRPPPHAARTGWRPGVRRKLHRPAHVAASPARLLRCLVPGPWR